jgi:hypothetical protein
VTTKIFKQFIQKYQIPDDWRNAVITPIYENGERREPQNYRGYKIYCKILNMKLHKYGGRLMTETQN